MSSYDDKLQSRRTQREISGNADFCLYVILLKHLNCILRNVKN